MNRRKVLFVGLGGIGQRHLRNLRSLLGDSIEVHAYRTRRQTATLTDRLEIEPNADLEVRYGVQVHTELEPALAIRPEMAFICNPSSLHIPIALALADIGAHLFIEKPLSHDLEGVRALIEKVEEKKLVGFVGYQMRFHPLIRRLQEMLNDHLIGRPLAVRAEVGEYLPSWHKYEDYRQMYASRADLGGGVVVSQIHELDYLYWFFGLPQKVFTLGGHLSSLEIDVEDVASSLLDFKREGHRLPVHLHQDYIQRPPSRGCSIIGDQGRIVLNMVQPSLQRYDTTGQSVEFLEIPNFERNTIFLDEMRHFLDCVEGKASPLISLRDGANSLKMALAIKRSLAESRVVELSEFSI